MVHYRSKIEFNVVQVETAAGRETKKISNFLSIHFFLSDAATVRETTI